MAKIGEFAIAKFDNGEYDENSRPLGFTEVPCLIIGRDYSNPNEQKFIYWETNKAGKIIVNHGILPKNRLKSSGSNLSQINFRKGNSYRLVAHIQ